MIKIALVVYLALLFVTMLIYKKWSNPFVFFNLIWSIWLAVAEIGIDGVRRASSEVFVYFIIGGITFNVVGFVVMLIDTVKNSRRKVCAKQEIKIQPYLDLVFTVIQCVILVYYIYKAFEVWNAVIVGGSYEDIRGYYYSVDNFDTTIEYLLVTFVFDPLTTVGAIVFSINLFEKKKSAFSLAVILTNVVMRALISGGRMIIFELMVLILVNILYRYKSIIKNNKKKMMRAIMLLGAVGVVAVFINEGRTQSNTTDSGALTTTLLNFTGSFTYLTILENNNLYLSLQYGRTIFGGIIDGILMITNGLGLTDFGLITNQVGIILNDFYHVGNYSFNAMPTMYYFFITDFGKIGIIIGCTIFALYTGCIYCYCNHQKTRKAFALYMIMMLVVMESSMSWYPFKLSFLPTIIYILIFVSNKSLQKAKIEEGDLE